MLVEENTKKSGSNFASKFLGLFAVSMIIVLAFCVMYCFAGTTQQSVTDSSISSSEEVYIINDEVVETGYIQTDENDDL